ncbi:AAA family ATPase [Chloroflexota bacterium]
MKLAITGKGGVGKTTTAGLLARLYAADGNQVLAIDANPDANLGSALGIPPEEISKITPIAEMEELILERTGAKAGTVGGFFKLNPRVDDIPDRFSAAKDGIKLLIMGTVKKGGGGCICPESTMLKSLMSHLLLGRSEVVILDMDAGVEHIGRGTAESVDAFIVVVEPGRRSIETAKAIGALAKDIGIKKTYVIGNKVRNEDDRQFISQNVSDFELLGFIGYNPKAVEADLAGKSVFDIDPTVVAEARKIKEKLEAILGERK